MIVEGVELRWLDLHLRTPHRTSYGTDTNRPVILARVVCDGAEGWGECAAFAEPTYSEEYAEGAWEVLRRHLVPRLLAAPPPTAPPGGSARDGWLALSGLLRGTLAGVVGHRMAKATLEMAVVDASLRASGTPFAAALGVEVADVDAGAVVGTRDDPGELVDEVEALVAAGYRRVKLKIAPGWDTVPVEAVRDRFPDLGLQVDANGAYRLDAAAGDAASADRLRRLDDAHLLCVEQPLAADDLVGTATLARRLSTPVCLDESVTSLRRLEEALALGACGVVCIKPGRLGGYGEAVAVHDAARAAGVPAWCGGMLETGLARAANATLAGLAGFTLPGDLGGGDRFEEGDPAGALAVTAGRVAVWRQAGMGPAPRPDALRRVTSRTEWLAGS